MEEPLDVLTDERISLTDVLGVWVHGADVGAVVLFSGEARADSVGGKEVSYLYYDVNRDMAVKSIEGIVLEAKERWSLSYVFCCHRVGRVDISETAIVIVCSSSHREEAYKANRYILDRVKKEAPIWKKEVFTDGSYKWG